MLRIAILSAVLSCSIAGGAFAREPPGTDEHSSLHLWFDSQYSKNGAWCCNVSDGHLLEEDDWREGKDGYEVRLEDIWWPIPDSALRDPKGGPNPTGKAILWYTGNSFSPRIYCFAPGTQY